jgi:alkaline phosphatase
MLGPVSEHKRGMAPLLKDANGCDLEFSPLDWTEGGNMVLWDDAIGGQYPWDPCYYEEGNATCDITFIMQHATDSANTAGALATGVKSALNMLSLDLYEEVASTLIEDAMYCSKAGKSTLGLHHNSQQHDPIFLKSAH